MVPTRTKNKLSKFKELALYTSVELPEKFALLIGELTLPLIAIFLVTLFGVVGYMLIEGWSFLDALYMTVITFATIGYGETHPLSQSGRLFTIVLIVIGLGVVAVIFTAITQKIVQRQFVLVFNQKKMFDAINKLRGHTIICGYGRLARIAAAELKRADTPLVLIERDPTRAAEARSSGYLVVEGDATIEDVLLTAGLQRAESVVSLLPKDSDNLYVILTSREIGPDLYILSRAEDEAGEKRLRRAGASRLMSPYRIGGHKIAEGLLRPHVTDFLDLASAGSHSHFQIEEIQIPNQSPLIGVSLRDAELRKKTNVIVAAIISKIGEMSFNPAGDTIIEGGATFIALGKRPELTLLENLLVGGRA